MSDNEKNAMQEFNLNDIPRPLLVFVGGAFMVALGMLVAYLVKFAPIGLSNDQGHWGQFGDFLGGVLNPLVAFAALLALLYATGLQRAELRAAQVELKRSAEAMLAQHEVMKQEAFEATFFRLLDLLKQHRQTVADAVMQATTLQNVGGSTDSFMILRQWLSTEFSTQREDEEGHFFDYVGNRVKQWLYGKQLLAEAVQHHVANLIVTLQFLESARVPADRRHLYESLLHAHSSRAERQVVLYKLASYAAKQKDGDGTGPLALAAKCNFFFDLNKSALLNPNHLDLLPFIGKERTRQPPPPHAPAPTTPATATA